MPQRKLTPEQELELVVDHEDGFTPKELTIRFKVSVRTVHRILARHGSRLADRKTRRPRKMERWREPKPRELKPCGTNAAYQRHRRKGEYPCTPCLEAHAKDVADAK